MPTDFDTDGSNFSTSRSDTHSPLSYDQITGNEKSDSLDLPSAAEVAAAYKTWTDHEKCRKRNEFYQSLPDFRKQVIAQIKQCYTLLPGTQIQVPIPSAIGMRVDLLNLEIIDWLAARGWKVQHDPTSRFSNYLTISMPVDIDQADGTNQKK